MKIVQEQDGKKASLIINQLYLRGASSRLLIQLCSVKAPVSIFHDVPSRCLLIA